MPNVFSPRDLVSRPDNMDETVLHTHLSFLALSLDNEHERMLKRNEIKCSEFS